MFVVLNDFSDDEVQKLLGEFGIEISLFRQIFEPCDLRRFAGGIGRGKVVPGLEFAHRAGMGKTLGQREDKNRIKPVDGGPVARQDFGSAR